MKFVKQFQVWFDDLRYVGAYYNPIDPLQAKTGYGMRDEQEKTFALQKGPINQDRLRTWSESSKHGRMFICFVGLIIASYVRHMWEEDDYQHNKFDSTEASLA